MGELPRPSVSEGPVRVFFDDLHDLHHRAGWPSLRDMAKEVGCSHTTISAAFSGSAVPRWGLVELIVEALGGDVGAFHARWLAASSKAEPAPEPTAGSATSAPRQLPADVAAFTGRAAQLAALDRAAAPPPAVTIAAVTGTGGVGKTALAVHWAHRAAARFPDGQCYLNLRGYSPDQPVPPAAALESLLVALGVARSAVPHALDERAALYRTTVAGKHLLIVLDNARSVEQVRDLLPGAPTCQVLVTSRDTLAALVARHGAVRVDLDVLTVAESVDLLRRLLGDRVDAEPGEAEALAARCARLPLAIRIAAELAAARPKAPLSWLTAELADEAGRLDLLAAGDDDETAVRAVFSWSCTHLWPADLDSFQLLGLHPGQQVQVSVAAALFGVAETAARRSLAALAQAHLVDEIRPGWFAMHDLLRAYAAEQAAGRADRAQARERLFDHYLSRARAVDPRDTWLSDEHENLVAVAAVAPPRFALDLSECLAKPFDLRAHYRDGLALHESAVRAARDLGDRAGEAAALNRLGTALLRVGAYPAATERHQIALGISRETGDLAEEAGARHGLGVVSWRLGRYADAREHLTAALAIRRDIGDVPGEGTELYGLGTVHRQLGDYETALDYQRGALLLYRACGDQLGESRVLNNLGPTLERMGRFADALDHCERSLALNRVIGNRMGEAVATTNLASAECRLGRLDDAVKHHEQALALYLEIGYRTGEADGRYGLGAALRALGRLADAEHQLRWAIEIAHDVGEIDVEIGASVELGETLRLRGAREAKDVLRQAHDLAVRTGDDYDHGRALAALAELDFAAGHASAARERWLAAADLFERLGVPEGGAVRQRLTGAW
ncbi:transcriptional regulator, SARP family [Alloactinosynnema sp. L-07]|uniref:ATP-binding protein n=1 Tax=Alloactinosynnema sp. L-07 TaxID=1653480 RepID=UPI00065EF022|nr:tetratricopeptide repeat protein [Alloactinosynnema sp. L-07]CRK54988.1 transcriptional regulator, SARP family [Alloactinosynnema sp. L-07]